MHRSQLLDLLNAYRTPHPEEAAMVARTRRFVRETSPCFERDNAAAHLTGSACVVNPARDAMLLLHHIKLDMWVQPGGHADGDADLLRVAVRETAEETGLPEDVIRVVSPEVFDVDVHAIPTHNGVPRHVHYDVRFLLDVDDHLDLPGNRTEAHHVAWVPLRTVRRFNPILSLHRMVRKVETLNRRRAVA